MSGSILLAIGLAACVCAAEWKAAPALPDNPLAVKLGDPFILHSSDGLYYMYGTSGEAGFRAWSSPDLDEWKDEGMVYRGATPESWTVDCFWAPEVYERGGKYYLWFSANWKHNPTDEGENFRIGVAVADSPTGPFVEMNAGPLFDPGYPVIDANLCFDDETGRVYLYYSRCCYKNPVESEIARWAREKGWYREIEESWIYGAEIEPDFSAVIGEPVLLLRPPVTMDDPQAEWESRSVTSREVNRRWTEGSFIFREGGVWYMMYSANFFGGANYAVGYATSESPLGPFTKSEHNPILEKNTRRGGDVTGTGHCMALRLPDGRMVCVYHARTTATGEARVVFIDEMKIEDGKLTVDGPTTDRSIYRNPVSSLSLPDPTVIKAPDGYFYLYATEDLRGVPVCRSENLTDWTVVGRAFTDDTRPNFEERGGIWAPDINYIGGQYVLYYSMSVWGGEWTCGIGVATSDGPEGPFTDRGKLFRSNEIDVQNSIDPFYIEDGGARYLVWGSFRGIYAIELTTDGLSVKEGAQKRQIAGTAFEGVYIHKRGEYYYMFASVGSCCEGLNSTYELVVGRSRSLFGPYVDKTGRDMMENGYSVVIGKNSRFVGNGHCSEIVQDDAGAEWILYHGVDTAKPRGRVLMLDRVRWDGDGWPFVEGGTPSFGAERPLRDRF